MAPGGTSVGLVEPTSRKNVLQRAVVSAGRVGAQVIVAPFRPIDGGQCSSATFESLD